MLFSCNKSTSSSPEKMLLSTLFCSKPKLLSCFPKASCEQVALAVVISHTAFLKLKVSKILKLISCMAIASKLRLFSCSKLDLLLEASPSRIPKFTCCRVLTLLALSFSLTVVQKKLPQQEVSSSCFSFSVSGTFWQSCCS